MRSLAARSIALLAIFALTLSAIPLLAADESGDWQSLKKESKRMKLDETAEEALHALFAEKPKAKDLYDSAYGWAVFDNLKLAFGFSGGGGNGVAVAKDSGQRRAAGCTCGVSKDIGSYNLHPCSHNCLFCYANPTCDEK